MSKNATELGHATDGEIVRREFDLKNRLCLTHDRASELFDIMAERFRRDTGIMAPRKDRAFDDGVTDEERHRLWFEWLANEEEE